MLRRDWILAHYFSEFSISCFFTLSLNGVLFKLWLYFIIVYRFALIKDLTSFKAGSRGIHSKKSKKSLEDDSTNKGSNYED